MEHFSGMHNWYACSHARPTFCNVCRDSLSGVTSHGLSCEGRSPLPLSTFSLYLLKLTQLSIFESLLNYGCHVLLIPSICLFSAELFCLSQRMILNRETDDEHGNTLPVLVFACVCVCGIYVYMILIHE